MSLLRLAKKTIRTASKRVAANDVTREAAQKRADTFVEQKKNQSESHRRINDVRDSIRDK